MPRGYTLYVANCWQDWRHTSTLFQLLNISSSSSSKLVVNHRRVDVANPSAVWLSCSQPCSHRDARVEWSVSQWCKADASMNASTLRRWLHWRTYGSDSRRRQNLRRRYWWRWTWDQDRVYSGIPKSGGMKQSGGRHTCRGHWVGRKSPSQWSPGAKPR